VPALVADAAAEVLVAGAPIADDAVGGIEAAQAAVDPVAVGGHGAEQAQAERGVEPAALERPRPEPAARQQERAEQRGRAGEEHLGPRRRHVEGERPEGRHEAQPVDGDERQELARHDEHQGVEPGAQALDVGAGSGIRHGV
jgi:hypothetical protein